MTDKPDALTRLLARLKDGRIVEASEAQWRLATALPALVRMAEAARSYRDTFHTNTLECLLDDLNAIAAEVVGTGDSDE